MSIVKCPSCGARMSSLANECDACNYSKDTVEPVDPHAARYRNLKNWRYRVRMLSYLAMTVALAGVILWWVDSRLLGKPGEVAFALMVVGVIAYGAVRIGLLWIRWQIRDLLRDRDQT